MHADDVKRISAAWRTRHARPAWRPQTRTDGEGVRSWFGGRPLTAPGHAWPTCAGCSAPMRFLVQLDVEELPDEFVTPLPDGVVQLFYCQFDDGDCSTWEPFGGCSHVRVLPRDAHELAASPVEPDEQAYVVAWELFEDHPGPEDFALLGLTLDYDFDRQVVTARAKEPAFELVDAPMALGVAELISEAVAGDKLGGWPLWIQGAEYPPCPECGAPMQVFLQLDSECNLPWMFGDAGCGHLTQCARHPHVMAFGWACS